MPTPVKGKQPSSGGGDHTYFRQKSNSSSAFSAIVGQSGDSVAPSVGASNAVKPSTDSLGPVLASKSVTTLELHSEDKSTSMPDVTLTFTECPALQTQESLSQNTTAAESEKSVEKKLEQAAAEKGADGDKTEKETMEVDMESKALVLEGTNQGQTKEKDTDKETIGKMETDEPIDTSSKIAESGKEVDKQDIQEKSEKVENTAQVTDANNDNKTTKLEPVLVKEETTSKTEKETKDEAVQESDNILKDVKNVISHIEDLIEEMNNDKPVKSDEKEGESDVNKTDEMNTNAEDKINGKAKSEGEDMEIDNLDDSPKGSVRSEKPYRRSTETNPDSRGSDTNPAVEAELLEELDSEKDARLVDQINSMLQLPVETLHKDLVEKCRKALLLCLQRFSTHYKSHYRLAYMYVHSPYHRVS